MNHSREYVLNYISINREKLLEQNRVWRKNNKERMSELRKNKKNNDKRRHNARASVWQKIKRGTIKKEPCCICGSIEKIEAHHFLENREKEFDFCIVFLCRKHHLEIHRLSKDGERK